MKRSIPARALISLLSALLWPVSAAAQVPAAPMLVSPGGSGIAATPTYTWNAADIATHYYLWVNGPTGSPVVQAWHAAGDVCAGSVCSVTPATSLTRGAHVWWVQARNGSGDGPWSAGKSFTVGSLPAMPTLASPRDSGVSTTPTYSWSAAADTDEYSLQVNDANGTDVIHSRFGASEVCGTTCAVTPGTALALGPHTWWVQGHNTSGDGPWSTGLGFVVGSVPSAPTPIAPTGSGVAASPTFSWSAVAAATAYELWVNGPSGSPAIHETYDVSSACSGAECGVSSAVVLPPGAHTWWVRARNGSGEGSWSAGLAFTVGTLPSAPTLIAPTGADVAESPAFTWAFDPNVTDYYLWVNGLAGTPVIQTWYSAASVCAGDHCTVTPPTELDRGHHVWWVQGRTASGDGPWSAGLNFVVGPLPGTASLIGPRGLIDIALPTYVWTAVPDAAEYYLWVNGPAGTPVIQAHYDATTACAESTTCVASPDTVLADGAHTWWIQARNESGDGTWSAATGFTVAAPGLIAAGTGSSYAVTRSGALWAWGINDDGQLGDGTDENREVPTAIPGLTGIVGISVGAGHVVALKHDGTVWTWGDETNGRLGRDLSEPTELPGQVPGLTDVIAVAAGWEQSFALRRDGTVWAWGANAEGQLGDGTADDRYSPVQIPGLTGVKAIAAGWLHGLALKSDGTVWTWGQRYDGSEPSFQPVQKAGLSGVVSIHTGFSAGHSFARTADGRLFAWGLNSTGELGIGSTEDQQTPVEVTALANVREVWSGGDHTVALLADGTVWTFGLNAFGELGDGTTEDRWSPVPVPGLAGIAHVSAGWFYSMALGADGTVYSWGDNTSLQLGDGTTSTALVPIAVSEPAFYWKAGTPTFAPPSGTYPEEQAVVLSSATPNATIAYTLDGNDPGPSDPTVPSGGVVNLGAPATLKARAFAPGTAPSLVGVATYTFTVGTPTMSPPPGVYATGQSVILTTVTPDAEIRYTTDGSEPTASSALYAAPISITATTTVQARAFRAGWPDSVTAIGRYAIGSFGALASGGGHSLLRRPEGTVWAWGGNWAGQLGDGTNDMRRTPVVVPGLTGVTAIAAGDDHSVALLDDGTVWAWGQNERGQLGTGTTDGSWTPVAVPGLTGVIAIASGHAQTFALKADGTVWAWGGNDAAELGDGTLTDRPSPALVVGLDGVTAIAAGFQRVYALKSDGTVWTWGGGDTAGPVPVEGLTGVNLIATGFSAIHAFARTADGRVWGWGNNDVGELGLGNIGYESVPVELTAFAPAQALAAGNGHSLIVKADGTVWATGWNNKGQIGDGTTEDHLTPIQVEGLSDIVAVSAGWYTSLALKADGTVYGWGDNSNSQLGNGDDHDALSPVTATFTVGTPIMSPPAGVYATGQSVTLTTATPGAEIRYTTDGTEPTASSALYAEPISIAATTTLRARAFRAGLQDSVTAMGRYTIGSFGALVAGGGHSLLLRPDGTVWAWGGNWAGQLGDGTDETRPTPIAVGGLTGITAIAAGDTHSVALKSDGTVWAWGVNDRGQLGTSSTENSAVPVLVPGLTDVVAISAGGRQTYAVKADGTVWAWGSNDFGELGNGIAADQLAPFQVPGLEGVTAIAGGLQHALALKGDGTVWRWGGFPEAVPTQVDGLAGVNLIATGFAALHDFARTADGRVWGWGNNDVGELGLGYTSYEDVPVELTAFANAQPLAAGFGHSLFVKADGTVWATGWNVKGQIGDGTTEDRLTPIQVAGLTDIVAVSASWYSSLALKADGTVYGWGDNSNSQLGDGTDDDALSPVTASFHGQAATPTFSVPGGTYSTDQTITLASATPGAVIHYATNGDDPTPADPSVPSGGSVVVSEPQTLWARAYAPGYAPSESAAATYEFKAGTPTFAPPPGSYTQSVSLSPVTTNAEIRYTTDGSEPTAESALYAAPIPITATTTIRARAFRAGWQDSDVANALYTIASAQVAGGYSHSVALDAGGRVWAWGDNSFGQLGLGTTDSHPRPLPVPGLVNMTAISAGDYHALALDSTGSVWGWGAAWYGQLGVPGYIRPSPVLVPGLPSITAVRAGTAYSLALDGSGAVWAWGANDLGQLGDGTTSTRMEPEPVPGLGTVTAIAAGAGHALALKADGTVMAWGNNTDGQVGNGTVGPTPVTSPELVGGLSDVTAIAAGAVHSLALRSDGTVWFWGYRDTTPEGEDLRELTPVQVPGLTDVVKIAAGGVHSLAIKSDGTVWAWGQNWAGQLGNGTFDSATPTPVPVSFLADAVAVGAGLAHSLAVTGDGRVWAWGDSTLGQVGDGSVETTRTEPTAITEPDFGWPTPPPTLDPPAGTYLTNPLLVTVGCEIPGMAVRYRTDGAAPTLDDTAVDCGGTIRLVTNLTLTVAGWYEGRRSETVTAAYDLPTAEVAAGARHFLYLDQQHALWAWGANEAGQLGDGTTTDAFDPVPVLIEGVAKIAVGSRHSLALTADGTVWAWGDNATGQLGREGGASSSPMAVEGLPSGIVAIAAGDAHSLALASDGTVWAWGDNAIGQLGIAPSGPSSTPAVVPGLTGVVQIAAGLRHNLARTEAGAVWTWGDNTLGQLGTGSTDPVVGVVDVFGLSDVVRISAGDNHSLAITADGGLLGWGDNRVGQFSVNGHGVVTSPQAASDTGGECEEAGPGPIGLADGGARHTTAWEIDPPLLLTWGEGSRCSSDSSALDARIARLSAAGDNNLAVFQDGTLLYWTYGPDAATQAFALTTPNGELRTFPPSFSVAAGTYHEDLSVTVTAGPGAVIHYTTDETTPDETSPTIASGTTLSITRSTLLQAMAVIPGRLASDVRSSMYRLKVLDPVVDPAAGGHDVPFVATITEATIGATLLYGVNTSPDTPIASGGTVPITPPSFLWVRADKDGWESGSAFLDYPLGVVTPTITPPGGHFTEPVTVTIATTTPGVSLFYVVGGYYLTDGSQFGTPIESGSTIVIDRSTLISVRGFKDGLPASSVASAQFYFALPAPTITAARESRPDGAFYMTGASVTPGATVRCTTDGTEPNFSSPVCNRPAPIDVGVTVKAKAYMVGWDPSPTVTRSFAVTGSVVSTPRFSLEAGRYPSRRSVVVTADTPSSVIHYTTNGTDPTASDPVVASGGAVLVDHSLVLKARAFVGADKSLAANADYELTGKVVASDFVVALKTDGTVWSWGKTESGRTGLGSGLGLYVMEPAQVGIDSVTAIAAGGEHALALKADGTVWAWGDNLLGQASGELPTAETPVQVDITDVTAIAAGARFSAALKSDGSLWAWGMHNPGSTPGDFEYGFGFTPHEITGRHCVRIYAGERTLICVDALGHTWSGGPEGFEQRPELQGLIGAIGGSELVTLQGNGATRGLARSDTVGVNVVGVPLASAVSRDLVLGPMSQAWFNPSPDTGQTLPLRETDPVVAISLSTVVGADGSLWRWGSNTFYEVGDPIDTTVHLHPFQVPGMSLFSQPWLLQDSDGDGLSNVVELDLGTDPYDADTNDDGMPDGAAVAAGRDPVSVDIDGDGLSNADEVRFGTDMLNADSDGDGIADGLDVFPLDPSRSAPATADPADTTPPDIILTRPAGAVLVSTVP